jgi:hypothetical protein
MARARADIERRDRELLEEKAALKAQRAQIAELERVREVAQSDPLKALASLGVDTHQVLMNQLNPEEVTAEERTSRQLTQMQQQMETLQKELATERQQRFEHQQINAIQTHLRSGAAQYPLLSELHAQGSPVAEQVLQQGVAYYQQHERMPDWGALIKQTEDNMVSNYLSVFEKIKDNDGLKARLQGLGVNAPPPAQAPAALAPALPVAQGTTLRQDMTGVPPQRTENPIDPDEARAQALKIIQDSMDKARQEEG